MNAIFEDFDDIKDLADALDDPDAGARIVAVMDLADSADPDAIPYIAKAITDADEGVRLKAAQALTDFDGLKHQPHSLWHSKTALNVSEKRLRLV